MITWVSPASGKLQPEKRHRLLASMKGFIWAQFVPVTSKCWAIGPITCIYPYQTWSEWEGITHCHEFIETRDRGGSLKCKVKIWQVCVKYTFLTCTHTHTHPYDLSHCIFQYILLPSKVSPPFFPARECKWVCEPYYIIYSCCKSGAMYIIRCAGFIYKAGFMVSPLRSADGFYCDLCLCHEGPYIRITWYYRGTYSFWPLSFFWKQRLLNHC